MTKREFVKKYLIVEALLFALFLALDLVSKSVIASRMQVGDSFTVIPHLFNFYYVLNTGSAFGMLQNQRWFFVVITLVALLVLGYVFYRCRKGHNLLKISLVMIMAGALGNLVDRLAFGYVRDFIQFSFWDSFAIFNFADAELVIGVVLFAIYLIFIYKEPDKKAKLPAAAEESLEETEEGEDGDAQPEPGPEDALEKHGED